MPTVVRDESPELSPDAVVKPDQRTGIFIGLGSNLGNRDLNLREARQRIEQRGLVITLASSIYETEPIGYADQPWFLNQVVGLARESLARPTSGPGQAVAKAERTTPEDGARALLSRLLRIEADMGRLRIIPGGPRIIDLDLLLFDGLIVNIADDSKLSGRPGPPITVPHPRMHLRRFVLEPLCEIAPEAIHPVLNKTCRELLADLEDA